MGDSSLRVPWPALKGVLTTEQQLATAVSTALPPDRTGGALRRLAEVSRSPIGRPGGLTTARCAIRAAGCRGRPSAAFWRLGSS